VRYVAPILLIKAVDTDGNVLSEFEPDSSYTAPPSPDSGRYTRGGDVGFEKQPDNRWRSSQLQPDQEISVTIKMDGHTCEPQRVTLPEGEQRELVFTMKKAK
jgi:hypothetical protein